MSPISDHRLNVYFLHKSGSYSAATQPLRISCNGCHEAMPRPFSWQASVYSTAGLSVITIIMFLSHNLTKHHWVLFLFFWYIHLLPWQIVKYDVSFYPYKTSYLLSLPNGSCEKRIRKEQLLSTSRLLVKRQPDKLLDKRHTRPYIFTGLFRRYYHE